MNEITYYMHLAFTYVLYPAVILGMFVYIFGSVIGNIRSGSSRTGRIRRLTAALLPLALIVFLMVSENFGDESLGSVLRSSAWYVRFLFGGLIGVVVLESGKQLSKSDSEVGPALYNLFLSTVGSFILYCMIAQLLQSIHVLLLGMVLFGGLHIVLRGPVQIRRSGS